MKMKMEFILLYMKEIISDIYQKNYILGSDFSKDNINSGKLSVISFNY